MGKVYPYLNRLLSLSLLCSCLMACSGIIINGIPLFQPSSPPESKFLSGSKVIYSYPRADGNHGVTGKVKLPQARMLEISLSGTPQWVLGSTAEDGHPVWLVALDDGSLQAFQIQNGQSQPLSLGMARLNPGTPPALLLAAGNLSLLNTQISRPQAPFSHPIQLASGKIAYLTPSGQLQVTQGDKSETLELNALPDARLLSDEQERLLVLSGPSNRYEHGVLGDQLEPTQINLIETRPTLKLIKTVSLPDPQVFEALVPLWGDLNADGQREIITTISHSQQGSHLQVFSETGETLAQTPAAGGQPLRWLHPIAVAPLGPGGETELVSVKAPETEGIVEFYQLQAHELLKTAEISGFTSHISGSRNLDMALAGDFDGKAGDEVLLPLLSRRALGLLKRTATGVEKIAELPVRGLITTNLATAVSPQGQLYLAVGTSARVLQVWLPENP